MIQEEERAIREIDKELSTGEHKTKQMLQFIKMIESPVNAQEE